MKSITLIFLLIVLGACSGLKLELKNGSNQNFKKVTMRIGDKAYHFENLKIGERTKFIKVKGTYGYFPTVIITDNDTVSAKGFCYVGEEYYKSGSLVVTLTIDESENKKFIEFAQSR